MMYLCARVVDTLAVGGPFGAEAEGGHLCSLCGLEVYTDPKTRLMAETINPPMRLVCVRCYYEKAAEQFGASS